MKWNQMTQTQKTKLLAYREMLKITTLNSDEAQDLNTLAVYCLENNLCTTEIPTRVNWSENIEQEMFRMGPDWFCEYYTGFYFTKEDGEIVNPHSIYAAKNPLEMRYREGLRKGLNHSDAKLYAYGKLAPDYEQTKQETL